MDRVTNIFAAALIAFAPLAGAGIGHAQTIEQQGYQPVDQLRDDVDPLSRSLRQRDVGLSITGDRQNVYRSAGDAGKRLYYISQGVLAEFDRSDYALTREGGIVQLAPPNLVYHIGRPQRPTAPVPAPLNDRMVAGRMDGRVNGDVSTPSPQDGRVVFSVNNSAEAQPDRTDMPPRNAWDHYQSLTTVMRMMTVGALGRGERTTAP
jgi:hypothetical protein